MLAIAAALFAAPGCAQKAGGITLSPQRLHEMASRKPKDVDDLVLRSLEAVRADLFLQEAYQSDAFLRTFFGSREVGWYPNRKVARPSDFRPLFPGQVVDSLIIQASISFDYERQPIPNASLDLFFMQNIPSLAYEKVVRLFGSAWLPVPEANLPPPIPNPHRIYRAPTHPFGNATFKIDLSDANVFRTIDLEFNESGGLGKFFGFSYRKP